MLVLSKVFSGLVHTTRKKVYPARTLSTVEGLMMSTKSPIQPLLAREKVPPWSPGFSAPPALLTSVNLA